MKGNLDSNLILAEGTLPGLLISIMFKENNSVTQNFLLGKIGDKFDTLRKLNGAKYRVMDFLILLIFIKVIKFCISLQLLIIILIINNYFSIKK